MVLVIEIPGTATVLSESIYPAIVGFLRREVLPHSLFGLPLTVVYVFIIIWVVVAFCLIVAYLFDYVRNYGSLLNWMGSYERDEHAESLLTEIVGTKQVFRVYRNGSFSSAIAAAFRPYIVLPEVHLDDDELRVILMHEWKHIRDKDYLSGIIVNLICYAFWWNPLVYVLRRNFRFAQELKCDHYAVSDKDDFHHFLDSLLAMDKAQKKNPKNPVDKGFNSYITGDDGLVDRLKTLALREKDESRTRKSILTNVFYSTLIFTLFVVSYMFNILPATWESPDVLVPAEDFREEYNESGAIFRSEESFLIDNGDGTFSLFIEGQFAGNIDDTNDLVNVLQIRPRNE